jgi:hypothetical protein
VSSMKTLLGGRPTSNHQRSNTPDELARALQTADRRVPEKQSAEGFLTSHLEPGLAPLLERRRKILEGLASPDATLETLAAAQLNPGSSAPEPVTLSARTLPELEREIIIKRRAITLQREVVNRARMEWSAVVCDQLVPLHRAQVHRIRLAIEELSNALIDHRHLVEELDGHDVANFSFRLRPMLFPHDTMQLDNESSSATWWMRDAQANGLLD